MKNMETERLLLRPLTLEDVDGLYQEIYADIDVVRYYSGRGVLTREQTRQHLLEHMAAWREDTFGRHGVFLKHDQTFLGQVDIGPYINTYYRWSAEPSPTYNAIEVELSFAFGRRFWGQGYAFEACTTLVDYAFHELRLKRFVGGFHANNSRSEKLQRRLGYRIEQNLINNNEFVTILENTLL